MIVIDRKIEKEREIGKGARCVERGRKRQMNRRSDEIPLIFILLYRVYAHPIVLIFFSLHFCYKLVAAGALMIEHSIAYHSIPYKYRRDTLKRIE